MTKPDSPTFWYCADPSVCAAEAAWAASWHFPLLAPVDANGEPAQIVSVSDVARFLPALGVLHAEPQGWAVVGVPANFWVDIQPITVEGTLLGGPAEVRFTPHLYSWDYGDGTTRFTEQSGASWASLGQAELTSTPTSHNYTTRADRRAKVTVGYSAEYRVGDGAWFGVDGTVSASTPPLRVLVVTEHTVLTATGASGR